MVRVDEGSRVVWTILHVLAGLSSSPAQLTRRPLKDRDDVEDEAGVLSAWASPLSEDRWL